MWFFRSPDVIFGADSLSYLNNIDAKRIVIVSDKNIQHAGLIEKVIKNLPDNVEVHTIDDIPVEPDFDDITQHMDGIRSFGPDYFIGVGGGSCMDSAKILFALYERPDISVYDITPIVKLGLRKKSHLIEIPTTSGTGSECSWAAVVSGKNEKRKNELASPEILADYAILDPEMVLSLPLNQTISTAVDAMTHAIESYVSSWSNPYSEALAEKGLFMVSHSIMDVLKKPGSLELRNNVHIGASMAGLSFSNSQIGLAHALGHSLGAVFKMAHGTAVGIFLPHVVSYNSLEVDGKYSILNNLFPEDIKGKNLHDTLIKMFKVINQPLKISDLNITRKSFDDNLNTLIELAEDSTGITMNPVEAGREEIKELFVKSFGD